MRTSIKQLQINGGQKAILFALQAKIAMVLLNVDFELKKLNTYANKQKYIFLGLIAEFSSLSNILYVFSVNFCSVYY